MQGKQKRTRCLSEGSLAEHVGLQSELFSTSSIFKCSSCVPRAPPQVLASLSRASAWCCAPTSLRFQPRVSSACAWKSQSHVPIRCLWLFEASEGTIFRVNMPDMRSGPVLSNVGWSNPAHGSEAPVSSLPQRGKSFHWFRSNICASLDCCLRITNALLLRTALWSCREGSRRECFDSNRWIPYIDLSATGILLVMVREDYAAGFAITVDSCPTLLLAMSHSN